MHAFKNYRQLMSMTVMSALNQDFYEFVTYWNSHHIRPTFSASCPSGRPDDLYDMPQFMVRVSLYTPLLSLSVNCRIITAFSVFIFI